MPSPRQIVVALLEEEDDDISPEEVAASATLPVPPDFAMPQGLSREGQRAWQVIVGLLAEHDALNSGGHTHVFYTPQEWADRGEQYGNGSELIVVHDGGDHARFFNADYNGNGTTLMLKALSKVGCYPPPMTSWSTAIHCDKKLQEAEEFDPQELVYGAVDPLYPDHEACGQACEGCGRACTKIHRKSDREPYRSKHLCARCDLEALTGSIPEALEDEDEFSAEEVVSDIPSDWISLEYVYRNQWNVLVMDAGYRSGSWSDKRSWETVGRIYYQPEKPEPVRWLASPYHGQQKEFRTPTEASNWMVGVPATFPNRKYSVDLSALPEELRS